MRRWKRPKERTTMLELIIILIGLAIIFGAVWMHDEWREIDSDIERHE